MDIKDELIFDRRALSVMNYIVKNGVADCDTYADFMQRIGISPANASTYRHGIKKFTKEHLEKMGRQFGVSMDYLFGFSNEMFRGQNKTVSQLLREATHAALQAIDEKQTIPKLKHRLQQKTKK